MRLSGWRSTRNWLSRQRLQPGQVVHRNHDVQVKADHRVHVCVYTRSADHTEPDVLGTEHVEEAAEQLRFVDGDYPPVMACLHDGRFYSPGL